MFIYFKVSETRTVIDLVILCMKSRDHKPIYFGTLANSSLCIVFVHYGIVTANHTYLHMHGTAQYNTR